MTTQQEKGRKSWRTMFRREDEAPVPAVTEAPEAVTTVEAPEIEIAPNDPIIAYLASVSGVVEVE
ncbi:MAG: hypothetical protein ACR2GU_11095, partial [Rubrobacteraceae bacterium]